MKPPIFRPAAAGDVEDAYQWYDSQRAGLDEEFLGAVRATLESLIANAESFPVVHRQTRRALLDVFLMDFITALLTIKSLS